MKPLGLKGIKQDRALEARCDVSRVLLEMRICKLSRLQMKGEKGLF
jgi:hypothetical protein